MLPQRTFDASKKLPYRKNYRMLPGNYPVITDFVTFGAKSGNTVTGKVKPSPARQLRSTILLVPSMSNFLPTGRETLKRRRRRMQQRESNGNTDPWQKMAALSSQYQQSMPTTMNGKKPMFHLPTQLLAVKLLGWCAVSFLFIVCLLYH